jgi:transposase-like protein
MSKTKQALELIEQGMKPAEAARTMAISESSVYAALRKQKSIVNGRCSCCGAPVDAHGKYVPLTGD